MSGPKPGTVAMVTMSSGVIHRAFWDSHDEQWVSAKSGRLTTQQITHIRTLVVLDIPERVSPALVEYLRGEGDQQIAGDRLDLIADQIEAQTKPPKPEEPTGLGAVVEDSDSLVWVRTAMRRRAGEPAWRTAAWDQVNPLVSFEQITAVRVLSEGMAK